MENSVVSEEGEAQKFRRDGNRTFPYIWGLQTYFSLILMHSIRF